MRVPALVLSAALLLAGCSGAQPEARKASPSPVAPSPAASSPAAALAAATCPASAPTGRWPAGVPADLPVPPTATMGRVDTNPDGLTLVRFSTRQSVRQGVLFATTALQPAGFALGRGDAEAVEADVPFSRGALRGLLKMIQQDECQTQWVLALQSARPGGAASPAPLLSPVTPSSPSPLPFG